MMEGEIKQVILDINDIRENILILTKTEEYENFKNKQLIYRRDYAPRVTEIIRRSEIILGDNNLTIIGAKEDQWSADVNYTGMSKMTESLSYLIVELVFMK